MGLRKVNQRMSRGLAINLPRDIVVTAVGANHWTVLRTRIYVGVR